MRRCAGQWQFHEDKSGSPGSVKGAKLGVVIYTECFATYSKYSVLVCIISFFKDIIYLIEHTSDLFTVTVCKSTRKYLWNVLKILFIFVAEMAFVLPQS